jgi:hypothetical protein
VIITRSNYLLFANPWLNGTTFMGNEAIEIKIAVEDVLNFKADVLVLKFAQYYYGADRAVYEHLSEAKIRINSPDIGETEICNSKEQLGVPVVAFIGVNSLEHFLYPEIRDFGARALAILAQRMPEVRHVALTLHGPGYGLDEIEAFRSEVAGFVDAINAESFPKNLQIISIVERDDRRALRLAGVVNELFPSGILKHGAAKGLDSATKAAHSLLQSAGYSSAAKPHVFVAMPFAQSMDDIFHYGILGPVNAAGLLCERADFATFTGDIMD